MVLANQTSILPTNKMAVTALTTPGAALLLNDVIADLWVAYAPASLATDSITTLVTYTVSIAIGWLLAYQVPDRANIPRIEE